MKLNLRSYMTKDLMKKTGIERIIELEKTRLRIREIETNKKLDGTNLKNYKTNATWAITTVILLLIFPICFTAMESYEAIIKTAAIIHGFSVVDNDIIEKQFTLKALEFKHLRILAKLDKTCLINGQIIKTATYLSNSQYIELLKLEIQSRFKDSNSNEQKSDSLIIFQQNNLPFPRYYNKEKN